MPLQKLSKILEKKSEPVTFARYMKSMRAERDMTQTEMADFLKISKSSLCKIENGRQIVNIKLAVKLAKKAGFSEVLAVQYVLNDSLRRAGLKMTVTVHRED